MNPIPITPITTNWPYLGLAMNTRTTPIPRMMIAVLKLLAPTSATIGRIDTMIFIRVRIFPISLTFFVMIAARKRITATLANSDG